MVAVFIVLLFLLPIVVSLKFLPHDRLIFKYKLGKNAQLKSSIATLEDILPVVSPYLVCGMASLGAKITLDYFANQKIVAELINGIPQRSQILEVEASDPKHIFYLPYPCEYTAHLQSKPNSDKDRKSFLDIFQLVSREGKDVRGSIETKPLSSIEGCSFDCVVSILKFNRLSQQEFSEKIKQIYRVLRPGGQFVFLCEEYIASNFISQLNEYFPEEIVGIDSAATKLKGSRKRDEEKRRAKDIIGSSKLTKKSRLFVELELLKASSKTPSTDQSNIKVEQMKARPGLISSVVDVLPWKKVVVGIAVKP